MHFAFFIPDDVVPVKKANILVIAKHAKHVTDGEFEEAEFINEEEDDASKPPEISVPMLFIGNAKLRNIVFVAASLKDTS